MTPLVPGTGSPDSGSASTATPVVGVGLSVALPLFCTPPCTSIALAVTLALPLAETALVELEST